MVIIMDDKLNIICNVIGYIICDIFLFWYLPNDTWYDIMINIVIMILVMFGVWGLLTILGNKTFRS
ncbi:hypothetical protein GCM10011538_06550 [Ligilactobacillus murinus]|uniref:DUF6007 family protein n=2 Tax=Ligilactobacillus murinus TaxID=1622 RepID=UPI0031E44375